MQAGDMVKHKKYGSTGIVVRLEGVGIPLARIIWTSSSATGACWPDEIEVISSAN